MRSTQSSAGATPSQSQSSARGAKSKARNKKARVSVVGGVENGADASTAASAATSVEAGAAATPAAAVAASPLSRSALLASLPHAISRRYPLAFHHCLRHALPPLHSAAGISTVASPALPSRFPRLRHDVAEAAADSAGAGAFLTQPLSDPTLGIRSLVFARTRPLLVVNSADCVFVWRGPDALRETDGGGLEGPKAAPAAGWSCVAILSVAALPAPAATTTAQTSATAGALPCPFSSCRCHDATRLPRQAGVARSPSSSSDGPVAPPAVFVCMSRDESLLYIAVNRQVPYGGGLVGGAQNASANAGAAMPSPASTASDSQSPWLRSLLHSPAPRSSPAHGNGNGTTTGSASPRVTTSSVRVAQPDGSPVAGGSQGIETAFDALFAGMDDDPTPTASATTSMGTQLPTKETSSPAASAAAAPAATQPLPQQRKSGGRKPKRKFTGPVNAGALSMPAIVPMRASFEVYQLRLAALDDAPVPAPSPAQSPATSTRVKKIQSPAPSAPSSDAADDDVDVMMADLLGQVNKHIASPPPRAQGKATGVDACDHLRLLFTSAAAVTTISLFGPNGLLVGDADGNVSVWSLRAEDSIAGGAWQLQRTLVSPRVSAIVSLCLGRTTNEERDEHAQAQVLVAVHRNADVQVWDVERGVRVGAIAASVHAQPTQPTPMLGAQQTAGADRDSRAPFVVSPTTSTPSSASPLHRSNSSQHTPLTPMGADGSLLIPETPSRDVASSLSETLLSPRQEDGERPLDAAVDAGGGGLDASVCVHAASVVAADEWPSQLQLLLLVSSPPSLGFHASAAASQMASPSQQPAPRKSSRKRGAVAPTTYPPVPCPAQLPSVVSLRLDLSDSARTAPLLDTRSFPVPLLLTDDNPSVHATCIGSSSILAEQVAEKRRLLASADSSSDAPLPAAMLACGLSSGALLLHSAPTGRLLAIMSDSRSDAEEALSVSSTQLSQHDDSSADASGSPALCESYEAGAVTFASAYDEGALAGVSRLSSSLASASALSSPAPSSSPWSSQRSPGVRATAASGRARRNASTLSSSPPPSSDSRPGEERNGGGSNAGGCSSSTCPSTLIASSAKHACTRSITAIAFHPLYHSLLAAGDMEGHVHVFTTE